MSSLITYKKTGFLFTIAWLLCFFYASAAHSSDKLLNFDLNAQPMSEVANQISKQLNYKVFMDETLSTLPVTGQFHDVTLEDFFARRVFRGTNIVILFDDQNQVVKISSLGQKGTMRVYNQTNRNNTGSFSVADPLDLEIQPGITRRDVVFSDDYTDPMDHEVQPGIKRRDVVVKEEVTDPLDYEIQPGVTRREVPIAQSTIPDDEQEIQPGIKRKDSLFQTQQTSPDDMEVQPGIRRADAIGLN